MRKRSRLKRAIWIGVALGLLLSGSYAYVTRPAGLRVQLTRLLRQFDLRLMRVGRISFSPWTGLHVVDMHVVAADDAPPASSSRMPEPPLRLRVPRLHVTVNPFALLVGRFQARRVEFDSPTIAIKWPATTGQTLWQRRSFTKPSVSSDALADLPDVEIKAADVQFFVIEGDRPRLLRRWLVDGDGAVGPGRGSEPPGYVLRFYQVAGPTSKKHRRGSVLAELRWQAGELVAQLGWVDLELTQSFLPQDWQQRLRPLRLSGQTQAKRLVLDRGGGIYAQLELADLKFCLPIEGDANGTLDKPFAQVTDAVGSLTYTATRPTASSSPTVRGGDIRLRVSGHLNHAATEVALDLRDVAHHAPGGVNDGEGIKTTTIGGWDVGEYDLRLRIQGLDLPTKSEHPRFVSSARWPRPVRAFLRDYDLEGRINTRLEVSRGPRVGPDSFGRTTDTNEVPTQAVTQYRGEVEVVDGSCRYFRFPYPVDGVHGRARFSRDGVSLEGLCARHGSTRVRLDGRLTSTDSWTGFGLRFRVRNAATDDDLYRALPAEYQQLWETVAPLALCDADVVVERDHGSPQTGPLDTHVRVDTRLLSGSLSLRDGERLEGTNGRIHIADGIIEFDDLHGYLDGAAARVSGVLTLPAGDTSPEYNVHVEVANAALQHSSPVHDSEGRSVGEVRFEGVGDVWGQLSSDDYGQDHIAVRVADGVLTAFDSGAPWTSASGWLCLRGDERRILSLTARRDETRLTLSGTLPSQPGPDAPLQFDVRADDAELRSLLRQLVPQRWSRIREALGFGGRGTLAARFHRPVRAEGPDRQAAEIQLEAERMRPAPLPLDLRDLEARLTLHTKGFNLHEATASYGGDGQLTISGQGGWEEGRVRSELHVAARDFELSPELVQVLPATLAALLERMAPRGRLHLWLDPIRVTGSDQRTWNLAGRLRLENAALKIGLPLSEFDGELSGACEVRPDGQVALEAGFAVNQGQLASRPIERWQGRLLRQPGSSRLRLEDVRGRLCDGEVVGFAAIDPKTSTYELSFALHDVSLPQLLRRDVGESGRVAGGRLDGHVFLRGDTKDPTKRSGGGELRILGSSLLSSPITASVVEASRRQARSISDEVEQAELRFAWEGQELKFSRVDIQSRDLRLIGVGRWNMRTDAIEMTLLGATPEHAPRLFLLTDLLESAGQELLQYRIEGTAAKPHVTLEPLHNLTGPLRDLLKGEKTEDDRQ